MVDMEGVCVYCGQETLTGKERPEHVIPAALGASITTSAVCDSCNTWAGREIDQPFLSDNLLREYRSMADQRDPRRAKSRRIASAMLRGFTDEGDFVAFDHETGKPVRGSRIGDLGGGRYQIRTGSEDEAARLLKKMRDRAAAEGKEVKIEQEERSESRPTIRVEFSMNADVWRREAAKIGLGAGSIVYAPTWRLSEDAHRLREWMNDRDPRTDDGTAPPLVPVPIGQMARIVRDDEHLLLFIRMQDGWTYAVVVLFGVACFAVPVDSTGGAVPGQAWRLDWRRPTSDGLTSFDDLVLDVVRRANEEEQDAEPDEREEPPS